MGSATPNLSPISGAFTHQFNAMRGPSSSYSGRMDIRTAQPLGAWIRTLPAARFAASVALAAAAACHVPPATAQAAAAIETAAPADAALGNALAQQVQRLARDGTRNAAASPGAGPGAPRIEVSVGELDSRLRLAPCERTEPHLPDGTRLWGKSRIGVRCVQGPVKWNVYLPVTVKVFGTGLVARHALAAGAVLAAADLVPAEVDLAEDASPAVADPDRAAERTLARPLKPGQSLRLAHLRPRQWFASGATVTVVAQGEGFSVSGQALALGPGTEGVPVRLRIDGGRVLTGVATGDHRVELTL